MSRCSTSCCLVEIVDHRPHCLIGRHDIGTHRSAQTVPLITDVAEQFVFFVTQEPQFALHTERVIVEHGPFTTSRQIQGIDM